MSDLPLPRPATGRRFALELRPTRPLTWIGPLSAALAGLIGSGGLAWSGSTLLNAALVLLLADPILGAWRALWVQTDWLAPLRIKTGEVPPDRQLVPYAEQGSPAARMSHWWAGRVMFVSRALIPELYPTLSALVVAGLLALAVSVVLGPVVIAITIAALALGPIEAELGPEKGAWPRALEEIGAAWLLGHAALALPTGPVLLLALMMSVAYRGLLAFQTQTRRRFLWNNLGQAGVAVLMAAQFRPLSAGLIGLSVLAQVLWQAYARTGPEGARGYLPRVQWFFLLTMFTTALAL